MIDIKDVIISQLRLRGVPDNVHSELPLLIKRSIIRLQNTGVLPFQSYEFVALDKKESKYDSDGTLNYHFIRLPNDLREIEELNVKSTDNNIWKWLNNDDFYNIKPYQVDGYWYTLITTEVVPGDEPSQIMAFTPFPEDTDLIRIKYKTDGTDFSPRKINEKYWEAILSDVLVMMGLESEESSQRKINELTQRVHMPEGLGSNTNKKVITTKKNFFGGRSYYGYTVND